MVRPTQGSYGEILQKVKKEVPAGEVKIDRVTKGYDGSLGITIKSSKEQEKEVFKKALSESIQG